MRFFIPNLCLQLHNAVLPLKSTFINPIIPGNAPSGQSATSLDVAIYIEQLQSDFCPSAWRTTPTLPQYTAQYCTSRTRRHHPYSVLRTLLRLLLEFIIIEKTQLCYDAGCIQSTIAKGRLAQTRIRQSLLANLMQSGRERGPEGARNGSPRLTL